jgi:hypothetical protein
MLDSRTTSLEPLQELGSITGYVDIALEVRSFVKRLHIYARNEKQVPFEKRASIMRFLEQVEDASTVDVSVSSSAFPSPALSQEIITSTQPLLTPRLLSNDSEVLKEFDLLQELANGRVLHIRHKLSGEQYALKIIHLDSMEESTLNLLTENIFGSPFDSLRISRRVSLLRRLSSGDISSEVRFHRSLLLSNKQVG